MFSNLCLKFEHTVFRSPSAHHQSSFQRHRDPREHIRGQKGPVEWSAARRFLSIIECRKYSILNQRGKIDNKAFTSEKDKAELLRLCCYQVPIEKSTNKNLCQG